MPKFFCKCAALLLAVGMLLASPTVFAQASEETSSAVGPPSTDSGPSPAPVVYFGPVTDVMYSTTREQWTLAEMPVPLALELFRADKPGDFYDTKEFGIKWNEQEYISGLATGAASLTITGQYFPLNPEDQALWDQGLILIDAETVPTMEIHVTREVSLPFTVELGYDVQGEGYYPVFSFKTPHGASEVLFEASNDGVTWISETQRYNTGAFTDKRNINSMQWLTSEEDHYFSAHQTSYYRVTVRGSAYDTNSGTAGSVSTFILNGLPAGVKPPDSSLDDTGGNRGGVGQEETDRVLPPKDESSQNASLSPPVDTAGLAPSGVAQSPASTAAFSEPPDNAPDTASGETSDNTSGETSVKPPSDTPEKISEAPLEEAAADEATRAMGEAEITPTENIESPAKPKIPGAVTAAVCTTATISAASVLLKINWQAVLKLILRKP